MVEESVAIVESDIQRVGGLPFFSGKEVRLCRRKISSPKESSIVRLKPEYPGEGILLKVRCGRE
jgi:hypothetical protein